MAEFFDQICQVLAKTAAKHPGQLAGSDEIHAFFQDVKKVQPPVQDVPEVQISHQDAPTPPAAPAAKPAAKPAAAANSLDALAESLKDCRLCQLCSGRNNIVFGEGNPQARLMFIGEGPGYDEDMQGRPFVGKAGQLLDKMIAAMQFTREEVYIANIVKCRPENNRNPMPDEIEACIPFLKRQIELIRPEVIVALGAIAAKALLNTPNGISKMRGRWCSYENIPVMPTFHPAFLLRQESAKREAWQDLQQVMARFGKVHRK